MVVSVKKEVRWGLSLVISKKLLKILLLQDILIFNIQRESRGYWKALRYQEKHCSGTCRFLFLVNDICSLDMPIFDTCRQHDCN